MSHNVNLEITDKGIFFYQFGFIPWFEILDIYFSNKENEPGYMTIKINNARKYLRNASVSYRLYAFFKKDESDELIFREAFFGLSRIYNFATSMHKKYHHSKNRIT